MHPAEFTALTQALEEGAMVLAVYQPENSHTGVVLTAHEDSYAPYLVRTYSTRATWSERTADLGTTEIHTTEICPAEVDALSAFSRAAANMQFAQED